MSTKHISRGERIGMFLNEYYFGYNFLFTFIRLILGPVLIVLGYYLYMQGGEQFMTSYGGFSVLYGSYYTLKPFLWVLFRFDSFKSTDIMITVSDESMHIKEEYGESEVKFDAFKKIAERKGYFTFLLSRTQKLFIPKRVLTTDAQAIIQQKIVDK